MTSTSTKSRILVVEDEMMIALEIDDALEALGCEVVGPVATVERALELSRQGGLDGAILDIAVRDGRTYAVAEVLSNRGVPFVFASGYGEGTVPPPFRDRPRLAKPFTAAQLERHVRALESEIARLKLRAKLAREAASRRGRTS